MSFLKNKNMLFLMGLFLIIILSSFKFVSFNEVIGLKHPESAFLYNGYIYVSNIGSSPVSRNLDGFITKLDKYGNILEYKFIDGLQAPKGVFPYKNRLFIADLNRICVADLNSATKRCVDVKGSGFLNDVFVLNGAAYVTDTWANCIFKMDQRFNVSKFYCAKNFSPNGIWFSKELNAFVVVSFDEPVINIISINGKLIDRYSFKGLTGFDGLIIRKNTVYISDYRTGKIIVTSLKFNRYRVLKKFSTPVADFFINKEEFIAPLLEDNRLFIGKIK